MSTRNLKIDTLRGLACVLLVTYHVIGPGSDSGLRIPDGEPVRLLNDSLVYLRMPLFSFLSGFVYAWRPFDGDATRFVTGKVKRLLIPMLLVGTFFAVLQANTPGANDRDYDWSMLHIIPVAHYWFLESLFIIFMLVSALERLGVLRTKRSFAVIWLAAVALHLMDPLPVYFGMLGAVYLLPYFLLGVWCNRFGDGYPRHAVLTTAAVIVLAVVASLVLSQHDFPSRNSPLALLLGLCSCLFLINLRSQSHRLAWIGVHSFSIYLFHTIFSAASRIVLERIGDFPTALLLVSGITAGLLGPIVVEAALRRVPSIGSWVLGESITVRERRRAVEARSP